uniref:Uncharacterized protein n=1 Tax=Panstrongylus lignarius TaxID=156445 RepID=A0A224XT93_9HEMI
MLSPFPLLWFLLSFSWMIISWSPPHVEHYRTSRHWMIHKYCQRTFIIIQNVFSIVDGVIICMTVFFGIFYSCVHLH